MITVEPLHNGNLGQGEKKVAVQQRFDVWMKWIALQIKWPLVEVLLYMYVIFISSIYYY